MYDQCGATKPETWSQGIYRPDGHTVSVSDIHFVAHHTGSLATKNAVVAKCQPKGMMDDTGEFHTAQVFIKCVGFHTNEGNERLLGRATMDSSGNVANRLMAFFEPHLDVKSTGLPFASYLNAANFYAKLTALRYTSTLSGATSDGLGGGDGAMIAAPIPTRINHVTSSQLTQSMLRDINATHQERQLLVAHLEEVYSNSNHSWAPEAYERANRQQWRELHEMLAPGKEPVDYLFGDCLTILENEAPHMLTETTTHAWQHELAPHGLEEQEAYDVHIPVVEQPPSQEETCHLGAFAGSLAALPAMARQAKVQTLVLDIVRDIISEEGEGGSAIGADVPLMESGVDSLAAAELMTKLRDSTALDDLSPTLVFEQPTARAIAKHLLAFLPTTMPMSSPLEAAASARAPQVWGQQAQAAGAPRPLPSSFAGSLASLPAMARQAKVQTLVLDIVRDIISEEGEGGSAIGADVPLMESGVDSLAAAELMTKLRDSTALDDLSPTLVFEQPTARAIAKHVSKSLQDSLAQMAQQQQQRQQQQQQRQRRSLALTPPITAPPRPPITAAPPSLAAAPVAAAAPLAPSPMMEAAVVSCLPACLPFQPAQHPEEERLQAVIAQARLAEETAYKKRDYAAAGRAADMADAAEKELEDFKNELERLKEEARQRELQQATLLRTQTGAAAGGGGLLPPPDTALSPPDLPPDAPF